MCHAWRRAGTRSSLLAVAYLILDPALRTISEHVNDQLSKCAKYRGTCFVVSLGPYFPFLTFHEHSLRIYRGRYISILLAIL
jgi:hypothetical protein